MKIVITNHARDRIVERVKCRPEKVEKLVQKAWEYGTEPSRWFMTRREMFQHYEWTTFKVFMGGVFTFVKEKPESEILILTTCLNYNHEYKKVHKHD